MDAASTTMKHPQRLILATLSALAATARADGPSSQPIVASSAAIAAKQDQSTVEVNAAGMLDVHVRDTAIATVLEMLSYQVRSGIVTSTSVTGKVSANLYNVTLEAALDAILTPNQLGWRKTGNVYYVSTLEELAARQPLQMRVFKLRYLPRAEAVRVIQPLLTKAGSIGPSEQGGAGGAAGGGSGPFGATSGGGAGPAEFTAAGVEYLVITESPERLDAIAELLREIDERPRQVLIEATILRATLNENNQFGIDLTLLSGVDFQNVSSTSDASSNLRTGALPPDQFQETTFNVNTDLIGNTIQDGFTFGIIRNNMAAFIRALEAVTDVTVLANPKVVALNRQEAEVIVGRRDGYLTTTVTQTAAVQTVEFLETGTQIRLRPVINDDGTVRLHVSPKDSNGGLTAANLPFEETTEAHAQLLIDDGHTVLIGGLFRERTVSSKSQVPVLGNIPLAGALFQKQVNESIREEVIILLTVHVLKETPAEQQAFEELLADVERIRVGTRKGLMLTGRERLAQAFYEEALRQAERGDDDCAYFNVLCSLHNQPRHIGAIKLREKLTGQRLWESEGVRLRGFALRLIETLPPTPPPHSDILGRPPLDDAIVEGRDVPELEFEEEEP